MYIELALCGLPKALSGDWGGRRWIGSKEQQQQAVFIQWESDILRYVRAYPCDLLHSFIHSCVHSTSPGK